jgi:hypothetical protein
MRIIVIDPKKRTIEERQLDPSKDDAQQIHDIIGDYFTGAFRLRAANGGYDICYVDDHGLYKDNDFWLAPGWGLESYAGIGVITGDEINEESQPANVTLDEVKRRVVWAVPVSRISRESGSA